MCLVPSEDGTDVAEGLVDGKASLVLLIELWF